MLTLKERIEELVGESYPSHMSFFQDPVRRFLGSYDAIREQGRSLRTLISSIQQEAHPLKSTAQTLANSLRDFIFGALSFCTEHEEFLPQPGPEFEHFFLRSDLAEFMSKEDSLVASLHRSFATATQRCLVMAAKYQSVRPQSFKSNKQLADMVTFPHFCEIEEDVFDLDDNLKSAKLLLDDLYMMYFKLMETSAVYHTDQSDPVSELESIAGEMRERLGECERLFARKTSFFKKLYDNLKVGEREEFTKQLWNEQPPDEGEEEEEPIEEEDREEEDPEEEDMNLDSGGIESFLM
jgi:chemotaxis protein histidine kinase CheA